MMIRKSRRGCVSFLMVFSCLLAFTSFAEGAVKRVTVNGGIAPRDGNSWEKAFSVEDFRNIHAMTPDAEFWLAAGVYAPGTALQRDNAFFLASGTSIYGGFAGNETSRDQRDPRANITVLTGDIDGNDTRDANGVTTAINGNNSYTVVVAENVNSTAILDGVVITGGDASNNGGTEFQKNGGGMVCKNSSAIVRSCSFAVNRAVQYGGAAAIQNQSPAFANCTFSGNSSGDYGGAVFVYGASPVFTNCTFSDNDSGASGGGMYNYDGSSPTVTGCTFSDNSASDNGGGMANVDGCHPAVKNCTFSGNEAQTLRGGGMFNSEGWGDPSSPTVMNCTFTGNTVPGTNAGGGMFNFGASSPTVTNSIFWGNTGSALDGEPASAPVVSHCVVQGGFNMGTHIHTDDPKLGPLADNGGLSLTHALLSGSSALDRGTSAGAPSTDQRGVSRPQGSGYDIGAFELAVSSGGGGGGGCGVLSAPFPGVLLLVLPLVLLFSK